MCVSKFLYYFKAIWVECSLISSWAAAHSVVEVGEGLCSICYPVDPRSLLSCFFPQAMSLPELVSVKSESDLSVVKSPILELLLKFHSLCCTLILCSLPTITPDFFRTISLSWHSFTCLPKMCQNFFTPNQLHGGPRQLGVIYQVLPSALFCYWGYSTVSMLCWEKNIEKIQYVKIQCRKMLSRLFSPPFSFSLFHLIFALA